MKSYDVLGYTADGDMYCVDCTRKRYGIDTRTLEDCDPEGICPIFADSEWDYLVFCADCNVQLPVRLTGAGKEWEKELEEACGS